MPNFMKGSEAAEQAAAKSGGGRFARVEYFSLEDKESAILRFLTEHTDWITVNQHQMVPTKAKPADFEGDNWPDKMGAVCRYNSAFQGEYSDCYICDNKLEKNRQGKVKQPQPRTWALACVREEVKEGGKVVGIRDKTREVKRKKADSDEMELTIEKDIVVVRFAWSNFWHNIQAAAGVYGTVLDRDFFIKRSGSGLDTEYNSLPLDPITTENGDRFDLRNPEYMKLYANDYNLEEIITKQSSDEYYARFFDPRATVDKEGNVKEASAEAQAAGPAKSDNDMAEDRLKALQDRVKSYGSEQPSEGGMKNVS